MNESVDWREALYIKSFDEELRGLERRKEFDPNLTIEDLEKVLQGLYIIERVEGRGEVVDISMAAGIAAHEHFIAQWKADKEE